MMNVNFVSRILILLNLCCFFSSLAQKELLFTDHQYEEQIRTVMLHPANGVVRNNLLPAVASIANQNLVLEFDDLQDSQNSYYVKLIHCTYDWEKSSLMDMDFMREFNEFNISNYQFSSSLTIQYVHYRFEIPAVKLPGNYLVIVYRDGDKTDLVLSRRMMIYSSQAAIATNNQFAGAGALRSTNQQINFTMNYDGVEVQNPMENLHVVIRQNQRWDNLRTDVKPAFIREDLKQLEYRFLDQDNQFQAGNEFRFVDFRSLNSPGQFTARLNKSVKPFELDVQTDKSRDYTAYAQYKDMNGGYVIENLDYQDAEVSSSYVYTNFLLTMAKPLDGEVFVNGAMTNWQCNDENRMTYNSSKGAYEGRLFLKQGLYNYEYAVRSKTLPAGYLEGNHFETENVYEVFVYYRSLQPNADLLIGYFTLPVNPR